MDPAQVAAYAAAQFQPQQPQPQPQPVPLQHSFPAGNTVPSHPSYPEMIRDAIEWENKQGKVSGSSKRAIDKYILRAFTDLPPTHSSLLTHHLQRLRNAGQLVMIKNSYQLPSYVTVPVMGSSDSPQLHQLVNSPFVSEGSQGGNYSDTPKKRRGRPPKLTQTPPQQTQFQAQDVVQAQPLTQFQAQPQAQEVVVNGGSSYQLPSYVTLTVPVPGSSDSPQLQQLLNSTFVSEGSQGGNYSDTPKKRRGRPPKLTQTPPQAQAQAQPQPQVQPQNQPQAQEVVVNGGSSTGKRPRGRPPRTQVLAQEVVVPFVQPVPEVVSNSVVNGNVNGVGVVGSFGKRRGRPPRKQVEVQHQQLQQQQQQQQTGFAVDLGTLEERSEVSLSGKRRGRPPKKQKEVVEQLVGFQVELDGVNANLPVYEETLGSSVKRREVRGVGVGRGRPKMIVGNNVVAGIVEGGKKKRGWPKGKLRGKRGLVAMTLARYAGKKRGRKPKSALGVVGKVEKKAYSGKPRGRKKKSATFGQGQETATEELQRTIEDMQSKLKDAVRVIKPHLAQSPPDALAALQQLEYLSTMNVTPAPALTTPPVIDVTMDVTAPPQTTSAADLTPPNLTALSLAAPTMTVFTATQGMNVPLSYSMNVQPMTLTPSFQAPIIENQQPSSWIPSNGGQL